jgi:SHS2 domain-containing protein
VADPGEEEQHAPYTELHHPADILLEVWGKDLRELFENALFALYDQIAELDGFETTRTETFEAEGATSADALRALLSEALYHFDTKGFIGGRAEVEVENPGADKVRVRAQVHGENVDRERHTLRSEVKGVTYHQLSVEQDPGGGWRATVLFDV